MGESEDGIQELRSAASDLRQAIAVVRDQRLQSSLPTSVVQLPAEASSWNFVTFEKYINQRFSDLSSRLDERAGAQQTGLAAALAAAEKAVNAALIAAEKAVDKAEGAQQLRNEAQNEFRKSLSDLSGLMWTSKEGQAAVEGAKRELLLTQKQLEERINKLESGAANIQGRIWAISAVWAVITLGVIIGSRFIGH